MANAQSIFQSTEVRQVGIPSLHGLVGNFSKHGSGDFLVPPGVDRNIQTPVFEFFSQTMQGRQIKQIPGPSFLYGTSTVIVTGQDPASIAQIAAIHLDQDPGTFLDLAAVTSTGKLLVLKNKGQSLFSNGFDDLETADTRMVFDLRDPSYTPPVAITTKTAFTVLKTGDFDGNGCDDIVTGGVGYAMLGNSAPHWSIGLHILWCTSPGQFVAQPQFFGLQSFPLDIEWRDGTLYVLAQDPQTLPWTNPANYIHAFRFGPLDPVTGTASSVQHNPVTLSFAGVPTSLAVGDLNQDNTVDFIVSGNNAFGTTSGGQGSLHFFPGMLTAGTVLPTLPGQVFFSPYYVNTFDLQGLQILDLNYDGVMDLAGLIAYGVDPQFNPQSVAADLFYSYGPFATLQTYTRQPLSGTFPILAEEWPGYFPHYKNAPDVLQFYDIDRDDYPDLFVSGLSQGPYPSTFEVLMNSAGATSTAKPYAVDYGSADTIPRGPLGRSYRLGIDGEPPAYGVSMNLTLGDLSNREHVAFFYDFSPVDIPGLPTPGVFGSGRNIWLGVLPAFTSYTLPTGPSHSALGTLHTHRLSHPFNIPNNPSLAGYPAFIQAIIFDEVTGMFYSSQGLALHLRN